MITPFDSAMISKCDNLVNYGRKNYIKSLDTALKSDPIANVFIRSPKGTGKTTLLKHYFSQEKIKSLASQGILVEFCYLTESQMRSDADVYLCLIEAITNCLHQIENQENSFTMFSSKFQALKENEKHKNYINDEKAGSCLLNEMLKELNQAGFHPILILDDFHRLTCSECCSVHAFNYISALAQSHSVTFVVATDYHSKVASEAYGLSDFERIFDITIGLEGITSNPRNRNATQNIKNKIQQILSVFQNDDDIPPEEMIEISAEELQWLWDETAGVPGLLQAGMKAYYSARYEDWRSEDKSSFEQIIYTACIPIMQYWIKYFNDKHWLTLNEILKNKRLNAEINISSNDNKTSELIESGFIITSLAQGEYRFICPMFEKFLIGELAKKKDLTESRTAKRYNQETPDVFLSYKHDTDGHRVTELDEYLQKQRLKTFYDKYLPDKHSPDYHSALLEVLGQTKHFVVIISNYNLLTKTADELQGDWVNLEMRTFKKLLDEGRKPKGKFIILVSDEIFDEIRRTNKKDINVSWDMNTEIMPYKNYRSDLIKYLK